MSPSEILGLVEDEFPESQTVCSAYDVIWSCTEDSDDPKFPGAWYAVNDWVEVLGNDMKWKLARVKRVIKQAPEDWDWDEPCNFGKEPQWIYFYNAGAYKMLREEALRAPTEGLRRIFGKGPWLWQQYALLRYEHRVRFQQFHHQDFYEEQAEKWARDLFYEWVDDVRNAAFKERWDAVGLTGQKELEGNIFMPFIQIDEMTGQTCEEAVWDWDDGNISAFTYLAVLGGGSTIPLLVFLMQLTIPLLLIDAAVGSREATFWDSLTTCSSEREDWVWAVHPVDGEQGSFKTLYGRAMIFLVIAYYLFKVVPDTFLSFFNTAGTADSTYSRLMSLRKTIWDQGDDRWLQMVGFKMDLYMNTAFECILYLFNLFIIFNTNEILDVILNALAIEFVHQLDEEFRHSEWWDSGNRYMMAGAVELVIQSTLLINCLEDPERISAAYGIPVEQVIAACGGANNPTEGFNNLEQAQKDVKDIRFMTGGRALDQRCADVAEELGRKDAIEHYVKLPSFFGLEGKLMYYIFGTRRYGFFEKMEYMRTWSRWDKLLYLSELPPDASWKDDEANKQIMSTYEDPFRYHDLIAGSNPLLLFAQEVFETIFLITMWKNAKMCLKNRNRMALLFRVPEAFLNSIMYQFQCLFPFIILGALYYVPICY
jgi:hypothetical protein